jgi:hypothetical protein
VFIADFNQDWIKELTCTSGYSSCGSAQMFDNQAGATVELLQGPDGNIYQLVFSPPGSNPYTGPGELSRIAPFGDGLPTAQGSPAITASTPNQILA